MSMPSEIRRKADRVASSNNEFRRSMGRFEKCVTESILWWQSEAGRALRSQHTDMNMEMNVLARRLDKLEDGLKRLANCVQQADEERRRKLEEQRRLALTAKK